MAPALNKQGGEVAQLILQKDFFAFRKIADMGKRGACLMGAFLQQCLCYLRRSGEKEFIVLAPSESKQGRVFARFPAPAQCRRVHRQLCTQYLSTALRGMREF